MITALARPLIASGAAVVAAGALVLAPVHPDSPAVPAVHVAEVNLAGIGQDIYYAITPAVQYAVGGVSYLINFIPLIGAPISAQVNINYFQLVQPVIEATVNYLAAVVQNPLNIIGATTAYGGTLYDIGYNWVSAELVFFGLGPLPPLPQGAAARAGADSAAARAGADSAAARAGGERPTPSRAVAVPGPAAATPVAARRAEGPARAAARQGTTPRPAAAAEAGDGQDRPAPAKARAVRLER